MTTVPDPYPQAVGAISRLSSNNTLRALGIPRTGGIYDLGLEINDRMPRWDSQALAPFSMVPYTATASAAEGTPVSGLQFATEVVTTALHHGTHLDALVHTPANGRLHDGRLVADLLTGKGWSELGVETVPPIVGRCILLDVARAKDVASLPDRYEITIEDLEEAGQRDSIEIKLGDVVLVRTGKIKEYWSDSTAFIAGQPGIGPAAATWLYQSGMAVLGTDTQGTEPIPFQDVAFSTHHSMLVEHGVHLIENLYLEELSAQQVTEALFICLPLKITGATASFVRPVAIV